MCGIAGVMVGGGMRLTPSQVSLVDRMAATLAHRGPDDTGTWTSPRGSVGFGFRRLAILDVTKAGHQPMQSVSGRYTIVFNGEVYNYLELRQELQSLGHHFQGGSDTEVLLAAFEQWGVLPVLPRLIGMFAIAVHDEHEQEVVLIRDQLGIKPLYYHQRPGFSSFASQSRALRADTDFPTDVDQLSLSEYLCSLAIPSPRSVYSAARRLPAGHVLIIKLADLSTRLKAYSTPETFYRTRSIRPLDDSALVEEADSVLNDAVRRQLRSDVPLGSFLSGGIDSSLVTALAQRNSAQQLKTYSIGFAEAEFDESAFAAEVASVLGTDHTEIRLTHAAALEIIPELPGIFDEPFASPSAIPNYLLCRESRREVTVALSGTGGDEVFIGYNRYLAASYLLPRIARMPLPLRRFGARILTSVLGRGAVAMTDLINAVVPRAVEIRRSEEKLEKLARLLPRLTAAEMYRELLSTPRVSRTVGTLRQQLSLPGDAIIADESLPLRERVVLADQLGYLGNDQLTKMDTVSMAVGLEVRVPLLDQTLLAFSWGLPYEAKVRDGRGKWILRQVLHRYVPRELVSRPKQGLSLPIAAWLRGPLSEWADDLIMSQTDIGATLYSREDLERLRAAFLAGDDDLALSVWAVAMLHQWALTWQHPEGQLDSSRC